MMLGSEGGGGAPFSGLGVRVEVGVVGLWWQSVKPQPSKLLIGDSGPVSQPRVRANGPC